jgi:hypothetical protein
MQKLYVTLLSTLLLSFVFTPIFSQSPACANFSGVFISDSLEQNFPEYYVCSGSNIYLKSLNNPVGATFQWKKNGVNISGETTRKISVTTEGLYSLTMTVGACTATSSGIIVRQALNNQSYLYEITSNNISEACIGDSILLSIKSPKGLGLSYQWKKNNVNIIGAANSSNYKAVSTGNYTLVTTQGSCSSTSSSISLSFSNIAYPQILSSTSVVCVGKTTTLKTSNINSSYNLQWRRDGVIIAGENRDSLIVNQTGNYVLQATKGSCSGSSANKYIGFTSESNLNEIEFINSHSNELGTCENNVIKLRVAKYKDGIFTWFKDGNVVLGQQDKELLVRESGNYFVRYYGGGDFCYSQSRIIPIKITNNSVLSIPQTAYTISSTTSTSVSIPISYTGTSPVSYTVNYANSNSLNQFDLNPSSFNIFQSTNTTVNYSITNLSNSCGLGTSTGISTVTVGNCSNPTIIQNLIFQGNNTNVCIGGSKTISVIATGSNLSYQWQKDQIDILGETSNILNITNFDYSKVGSYSVKVIGSCGTLYSGAVFIGAKFDNLVIAKLDYPAYTNSDILLSASSRSTININSYQWNGPNGFNSTEQKPVIFNGNITNNGVYTVTTTNASGCINFALLTVNVVPAQIIIGDLETSSFCPNGKLLIPFTSTLPQGTIYKVYLTDQNGVFQNNINNEIGTGTTSPIQATLWPFNFSGTKYRIKIVSSSPFSTSTLSNNLSTDGKELSILVKNLKGNTIDNNISICEGSSLTGAISSKDLGVTFEWQKNNISLTTNSMLKISQPGSYKANVKRNGCNNSTKTFNINFTQNVNHYLSRVGSEYQCLGGSIIFRESYFSDSASYQWKKNGNIIIGEINDTLVTSQSGEYTAIIIDKQCSLNEALSSNVTFSNLISSNVIEYSAPEIKNQRTLLCGNDIYGTLVSKFMNSYYTNPLAPFTFQWKRMV